jgi:hypothetical protein
MGAGGTAPPLALSEESAKSRGMAPSCALDKRLQLGCGRPGYAEM